MKKHHKLVKISYFCSIWSCMNNLLILNQNFDHLAPCLLQHLCQPLSTNAIRCLQQIQCTTVKNHCFQEIQLAAFFMVQYICNAAECDLLMPFLKLPPIHLKKRFNFRDQGTMSAEGLPKALSVKGWGWQRD